MHRIAITIFEALSITATHAHFRSDLVPSLNKAITELFNWLENFVLSYLRQIWQAVLSYSGLYTGSLLHSLFLKRPRWKSQDFRRVERAVALNLSKSGSPWNRYDRDYDLRCSSVDSGYKQNCSSLRAGGKPKPNKRRECSERAKCEDIQTAVGWSPQQSLLARTLHESVYIYWGFYRRRNPSATVYEELNPFI